MSNPALSARVDALLSALNALQIRVDRLSATRSAARPTAMLTATTDSPGYDLNGQDNELQQRLRALCRTLGLHSSYFRRTPLDYYDRPLSFRKEFLGAPSEQYLCKSIICVNTHCSHDRYEQAHDSKYLLLVVQYTAKLDFEKVAKLVMQLATAAGLTPRRADYNFRLCPEAISDELSGFQHNAVTPLGMKQKLPIVFSHTAAALPFVWLGGGEVDVKWRVSNADFQRAFSPLVADITDATSTTADSTADE